MVGVEDDRECVVGHRVGLFSCVVPRVMAAERVAGGVARRPFDRQLLAAGVDVALCAGLGKAARCVVTANELGRGRHHDIE